MTKPRVAILGANGQVGSELALLLAVSDEIDLIGVVRSEYGATLLRLAGVPHATASFDDPEALARAIGDCDLVVDLTYPSGQLPDIPGMIEANIRAVMRAARRGAGYLHMSSIMAFGMPSGGTQLRNYLIPRASYGHIKRWAEGCAVRLGREYGVETFVFRLGQVHGVLQAVAQDYRRRVESGALRFEGDSRALSTTVFANAVADAVLVCARRQIESERTYTLVSNPQWSLAELADVYRRLFAPDAVVEFCVGPSARRSAVELVRARATGPTVRDAIETQVFLRAPGLFIRAKGRHRRRAVRRESASGAPSQDSPLDCLVGTVPGVLVPGIGSSPSAAIDHYRAVSARLAEVLEGARR
ncbi:MAG: hypothetical protein AMXMBFR56_69550 [Polyangiaceae bacterium]